MTTAPLQVPLAKTPEVRFAPPGLKTSKTLVPPVPHETEPEDPKPDPANNVFFSFASAEISVQARATLQSVAATLNEHRRETVILVGGTDDLGSRELCVAISSKRTDAVEAELLKLGVRPSQIRKRPRGCEAVSRQSCRSETCRHRRQRVEIRFAK